MSKIIDIESVLSVFVEDPERKYNVRELARITDITPSSASKYLSLFSKEGFLLKKRERNMVLFSANTESSVFRDFKVYYNIKKIRSSGLIGFIEKELNYPEAIILFGSYSKGENTKKSDIDLFIL
ncbi:MAG: nucleotidyltransferase domain-containing protein, partial [Candidatus Aenigmarchaeota archaeon]|nr:nucleotidyltransferase domain-containing protein [Candidatus Aenigmarchaeota archaeon]